MDRRTVRVVLTVETNRTNDDLRKVNYAEAGNGHRWWIGTVDDIPDDDRIQILTDVIVEDV